MNEKEIAEIRHRIRPNQCNITHIRGCYIDENREMVSEFDQPLTSMEQDESEKLLSVFKRTLSGTLGKNLFDVAFDNQQLVEGKEHKLLMLLRDSALLDEDAVHTFFQHMAQAITLKGSYLILLVYDSYDVPDYSKDGSPQGDAALETFSYLLCSVCPVKLTKPALSYYVYDNTFHNLKPDSIVATPELGFLFPAFEDRSTNLYNMLYHSRSSSQLHADFIEKAFQSKLPMPADTQKETFEAILGDTLADDCSYEVVQSIYEQLEDMVQENKSSKDQGPLFVSKDTMKSVLKSCGVSDLNISVFNERYDAEFGADADLRPNHLINPKQLEIRTSDVTISVNPGSSNLIETKRINGIRYILIRAEGGVEVNGVALPTSDQQWPEIFEHK